MKMKRLTKYDENAKCYLPFKLADWSKIKIMNKLGELEDVKEFEFASTDLNRGKYEKDIEK